MKFHNAWQINKKNFWAVLKKVFVGKMYVKIYQLRYSSSNC